MSEHLRRAQFLLETGRRDDAEREIRAHLSEEPDSGRGHALLGLVLMAREQWPEAEDAVSRAVHHEPDAEFCHYAMALVRLGRRDLRGARAAAHEALRLAPDDDDNWLMLARVQHAAGEREQALVSAERALAIAPQEPDALALRSLLLAELGRRAEAADAAREALSEGPDDDDTHAAAGWAALHANAPRDARAHFAEALRLDATNEFARAGLVEAIQATNPLYRVVLAGLLWMERLGGRWQWALIIGAWGLNRVVQSLARSNPDLQPVARPLLYTYLAFVAVTWLARPLANLCLRLHPVGRHALPREQRIAANWVGGLLGLALLSAGAALAGLVSDDAYLLALVAALFTVLPVGALNCSAGWPRVVAIVYSALCGALALVSCLLLFGVDRESASRLGGAGLVAAAFGAAVGTWILSFLGSVRPRR